MKRYIPRQSYIYVIFRLDGSPCYLGKGRGGRWLSHFKRTNNWRLRKLIQQAGGKLPVVKIRQGLTDKEAIVIEIALIAAIGRGNKGPLVNMTDGGDGTIGYKRTPEQLQAAKDYWKTPAGQARKLRQAEISREWANRPENKLVFIERNKKRKGIPTNRPMPQKTRVALLKALVGLKRETSEQTRIIRSKNMKASWEDPEIREKLLVGRAASNYAEIARESARNRVRNSNGTFA